MRPSSILTLVARPATLRQLLRMSSNISIDSDGILIPFQIYDADTLILLHGKRLTVLRLLMIPCHRQCCFSAFHFHIFCRRIISMAFSAMDWPMVGACDMTEADEIASTRGDSGFQLSNLPVVRTTSLSFWGV